MPGIQLYDVAPEATRVALPPEQNVVSLETVSGGAAVTVTITVSVALQPNVFVAVTT